MEKQTSISSKKKVAIGKQQENFNGELDAIKAEKEALRKEIEKVKAQTLALKKESDLLKAQADKMKKSASSKRRNVNKKSIEYQRAKDAEIVKGVFRFYESPGGYMKFSYKKYRGDKITTYEMVDGEVQEVPLGVAKHLNNNGWYPVHAYEYDKNDKPLIRVKQRKRRFGFESLEFVDIADADALQASGPSNIVSAVPIQRSGLK